MSNTDENFRALLCAKFVNMNSKREFRQRVKIYKASVVPRSFDKTVLVDIVKMQLNPIATNVHTNIELQKRIYSNKLIKIT